MIGTVGPTGPRAPERGGENDYRQEEEDARHLEPENAAHAAKGAKKAAHSAHDSGRSLSGGAAICFPGSPFAVKPFRSRRRRGSCFGRLAAGCNPLAGNSPGYPQPDSKRSPDALRSHLDMMVAVGAAEP